MILEDKRIKLIAPSVSVRVAGGGHKEAWEGAPAADAIVRSSVNFGSKSRMGPSCRAAGELNFQFQSTLFCSTRFLAMCISTFGKTDQLLSNSPAKHVETGSSSLGKTL